MDNRDLEELSGSDGVRKVRRNVVSGSRGNGERGSKWKLEGGSGS